MGSPTTLKDVAARAGVHLSTVSRVLRGDQSRISAETVQRVLAASHELGFQRNRWAASLRSGRTGIVGVLVPRITDVVLATVFEAIEEAATEAGLQAVVASSADDPAARELRIERYRAERVDGMIIADARNSDALLRRLATESVPFILASRRSRGFPSIAGRDRYGGGLAAEHLIGVGCRRLALVAGPNYASTATDRVAGFVRSASKSGVRVNPDFIVHSTFDVGGGYSAMELILRRGQPDGVFAVNDFAAIGAMGAIRDHGLEVGRDIAVVGYNDISASAQLLPPLTTVRTPLVEMGRAALDALLTLLDGGAPQAVQLTPTLVRRASTLAFRGEASVGALGPV